MEERDGEVMSRGQKRKGVRGGVLATLFNNKIASNVPLGFPYSALFVMFAILVLMLSGCATFGKSKLPNPPIFLPFAVHKAGSTLTTEFETVDRIHQVFELLFAVEYKGKTEGEEWQRFRQLVGEYVKNKEGQFIKPGIPIPLKVKISAIEASGAERIVQEKEVNIEPSYTSSNNARRTICYVNLPPGHYRVTVQTMKETSEFAEIKVFLGIVRMHKKLILF